MIDEMMTLLESDDEAKALTSSDHWTQGFVVQQRRAHSGHAEVDS